MRLLLVSDTHGHLEAIDALAREAGADAVLHAGDLGFYDEESVERLEGRELFLRVVHSDLPPEAMERAKKLRGAAMRAFIRERLPLSDLVAWLREGRGFTLPTYAVWGNHEDGAVVAALLDGRRRVPNLTLLGQGRAGPFRLFGLGGNLLPDLLHLDAALDEGRGKIRATAKQLEALLDATPAREPGEVRVLVTHVSPGKVPLVGLLAAALDADLTVSGHMGSPVGAVWDDFAVREPREAELRLADAVAGLPAALRQRLTPPPAGDRPAAAWYRGTFHVNLPDAPDGYGVLELRDGRTRVEMVSRGLRPRRVAR